MGQACLKSDVDHKSNFTFLTRSVSLSRLGSECQLNKQGLGADVLGAVRLAELRQGNKPVTAI